MNPKSILVASLVLLGLGASVMVAEAQGPRPSGVRAPAVGGAFTVNSNADNTASNSSLTLREAIYLTRDGTDGVNGLGRGLTDGEKGQTSGCSFTGSSGDWHISGGCGTAITDTILFSLGTPTTITLGTTSLPLIDDSAPTIIDGTAVTPTIDASGVTGSHNGLHISSNNNTISRIVIRYASLSNFYVDGWSNTLSNVGAWNAGTNGVYLLGLGNTIDQALIGVEKRDAFDCSPNRGNGAAGIFLDLALLSTITNSVISCNGGDGIIIDNGAYNVFYGNYIGTSDTGYTYALPNGGNGVLLRNGANNNIIGGASSLTNFVSKNNLDGVIITGTNTATNTLNSGFSGNTLNGIRLAGGAHNNTITPYSGWNGQNGVLIATGAHDNFLSFGYVYANDRNGIELTGVGTTGNVISQTAIYTNTLDGINERNGADNNVWTRLSEYAIVNPYPNGGLGIDKYAPSDGTNNIDPPFPVITSTICGGGSCTVSGTASPPGTGTTLVEVYAVALDPSGYGEGKTFLNSTSAIAGGNWTTSVISSFGTCFTAFQTKTTSGGVSTSSEFGPNSCRLFLPLIMK